MLRVQAAMVSYALNREDVVLWRALRHVGDGRFVALNTEPAGPHSTTRALEEHGWSGDIFTAAPAHDRPFMTDESGALHLAVLTTGALDLGALPQVLSGRPWVVVVSSSRVPDLTDGPPAQDVFISSGYRLTLFDGVSWFYVALEHVGELTPALTYPACAWDVFTEAQSPTSVPAGETVRDELTAEVIRWRRAALSSWASSAAHDLHAQHEGEMHRLREELANTRTDAAALRQTLSWRVTLPLRMVRQLGRRP